MISLQQKVIYDTFIFLCLIVLIVFTYVGSLLLDYWLLEDRLFPAQP